MKRTIRTAFSILALTTACLAPPATTRTERRALLHALREKTRIEVRSHQSDRQSHKAFALLLLGLDYQWKIVVATLSVPLSKYS